MHSLISLVNDNHADNSIQEILVYVYFGSTGNHPKISRRQGHFFIFGIASSADDESASFFFSLRKWGFTFHMSSIFMEKIKIS